MSKINEPAQIGKACERDPKTPSLNWLDILKETKRIPTQSCLIQPLLDAFAQKGII